MGELAGQACVDLDFDLTFMVFVQDQQYLHDFLAKLENVNENYDNDMSRGMHVPWLSVDASTWSCNIGSRLSISF